MNPLFYYLLQKDLNNFKQSLDNATSAKPSSSLSKSWQSATATEQRCDVNGRDDKGRTCLHLIAAMDSEKQLDFARVALSQLNINVNLQDAESGWTALHRAMYGASISFARLLLARDDIDLSIKDREGFTAFDLYNLSIDGPIPDPHHSARSELYTWGTNRNYLLGNAHGDDRQLPERISIKRDADSADRSAERFKYLNVSKVCMSKSHTGIITEEETNNVRFCGFGGGGRLGRSVHTQYAFETPSSSLDVRLVDMALAQDHTLLLDAEGHVYSFGSNKYQQLGYAVDTPTSQHAKFANTSDPFQITPKRIVGVLKKEVMVGVAAGKTASACWKDDTLYTWGMNEGHLGYDKSSTPVQSTPRKVTSIKQNVDAVAISDRSMGVLTDNGDVTMFYNSAYVKVIFQHFKSDRNRAGTAASMKPTITKLKCSSNTFGALSSLGEVFIFASPNEATSTIKPQKVWSFRNNFTAVKDFDVGLNGTVILCTVSGSVFVKTAKSTMEAIPAGWKEGKAKTSKFSRIPYLHRVSEVHASESGAFAALRKPPAHKPIHLGKDTLGDDLESEMFMGGSVVDSEATSTGPRADVVGDDENSQHDDGDLDIEAKIIECEVFSKRYNKRSKDNGVQHSDKRVAACDMNLKCNNGEVIPIHKCIYKARSPVVRALIEGTGEGVDGVRIENGTLRLPDALSHPLTLHILNRYLYTDSLLSIWDPRVSRALRSHTRHDQAIKTRDTLRALCRLLSLKTLEPYLDSLVVRDIPATLGADLQMRYKNGIADGDVRLNFADGRYALVDSVLLKTRTGFFHAMFDDPVWTDSRQEAASPMEIDMTHMRVETFSYILQYIYSGSEELNVGCEDLKEYISTLFEIIEYGNELMMDRLKLAASSAIRPFITLNTAVDVVQKAHMFECHALVDSILADMTTQLESVLEKHVLEDMDDDLLLLLEKHIRDRQNDHMPIRQVCQALLDNLVESNREWLLEQDIPQPILQTHLRYWNKPKSPKLVGVSSSLIMSPKNGLKAQQSPPTTPDIAPLSLTSTANIPPIDDIFDMDDDRPTGAGAGAATATATPLSKHTSPWQQPTTPSAHTMHAAHTPNSTESNKMSDFRSIIQAEAEASTPSKTYSQSPLSNSVASVGKMSQKEKRRLANEREKQERESRAGANAASSSPHTPPTPAWRVPERRSSAWGGGSAGSAGGVGVGANGHSQSPNASAGASAQQPASTKSGSVQSNVIVPTREKGKKISTQSGNAWSQAPAFASPPLNTPPSRPSLGEIMTDNSFEAIQTEQQDLASIHSAQHTRKKKSMVEIQREEREREEEQTFLKWWAEEERRTKEALGMDVGVSRGGRGGRGGNRGRGRGRGGAGGNTGSHSTKTQKPKAKDGREGNRKEK